MSHRTESATPLEAVLVAGPQVFLRRNIETEERTQDASDGGESATQTVYVADEVVLIDLAMTEGYAAEHFDELWEQAESDALSPKEYAARLKELSDADMAKLGDAIQEAATEATEGLQRLQESLDGLKEWQATVKSFLSKLGLK